MVISDNGASAEGGPTGTTNEAQFFNNAPESLEDSLAAHRRDRRPEALQPLPVGLDLGRQHAVPALEAGDLPRRRVATRSSSPGRRASRRRGEVRDAVRAHHRHGADRAGRAGIEPPATIRGVTAVAAAGRQLRADLRRRRGGRATHHTQYFEMLGPPGDLPRRLAGGLPVARARRSPRPATGFGAADLGGEAGRARRHRLGALPRRRGLRREPQCRGRPPRPA